MFCDCGRVRCTVRMNSCHCPMVGLVGGVEAVSFGDAVLVREKHRRVKKA